MSQLLDRWSLNPPCQAGDGTCTASERMPQWELLKLIFLDFDLFSSQNLFLFGILHIHIVHTHTHTHTHTHFFHLASQLIMPSLYISLNRLLAFFFPVLFLIYLSEQTLHFEFEFAWHSSTFFRTVLIILGPPIIRWVSFFSNQQKP